MALPLHEFLKIRKGVTAVIGSGGKTSLLSVLAKELPGKVILCTTSFFYPFKDTDDVLQRPYSVDFLATKFHCLKRRRQW